MGHPPTKKKLFNTAFKIKDLACFPVFNFFKGCINSSRPDWGTHVVSFQVPGGLSQPQSSKTGSFLHTFRKN
jgi:hypothetical protein